MTFRQPPQQQPLTDPGSLGAVRQLAEHGVGALQQPQSFGTGCLMHCVLLCVMRELLYARALCHRISRNVSRCGMRCMCEAMHGAGHATACHVRNLRSTNHQSRAPRRNATHDRWLLACRSALQFSSHFFTWDTTACYGLRDVVAISDFRCMGSQPACTPGARISASSLYRCKRTESWGHGIILAGDPLLRMSVSQGEHGHDALCGARTPRRPCRSRTRFPGLGARSRWSPLS